MKPKQTSIGRVPVALRAGEVGFMVGLKDPGIVRLVATEIVPTVLIQAGQPSLEERVVMLVEFSQDGPVRNRRFLLLREGQAFTPPELRKLEHVGTCLSQSGLAFSVFEIVEVN